MKKQKIILTSVSLGILSLGVFFLSNPVLAEPITKSASTDLIVNVSPVLSLALQNCPTAPDMDETSLTLDLLPSPLGTFRSNCQIVSVDTNAPGYTLLTKASGSHPQVNSGSLTNALIYQNPTTLVSPNYPIIAATASPISSPSVLTPNYWGFAVDQSGTNVSLSSQPTASFDPNYSVDNQANKFANLPITDTAMYQTTTPPNQTDIFNFYYGVNLNSQQPAGTYQTTITYTVVAEEVAPIPLKWKQIASGYYHSCALSFSGVVYCWGLNSNGQLGDNQNSGTRSSVPVAVNTTDGSTDMNGKIIETITSGGYHTCAIDNKGVVYCWGTNTYGQLGDNTSGNSRYTPVAVNTAPSGNPGPMDGKTIKAISASASHTCALDTAGAVYCWGRNNDGQIGDDTAGTNRLTPVAVVTAPGGNAGPMDGKVIQAIAASTDKTCALDTAGAVYCWGDNIAGQLGDDTTSTNLTPVAVVTAPSGNPGPMDGKTIKAISASFRFACALDTTGAVYCWGRNDYGQLGDYTIGTDRLTPVAVNTTDDSTAMNGKTIQAISTGLRHSCALDTAGAVYCWGYNYFGQLGDNSQSRSLTPVSVVTAPDNIPGPMDGKVIKAISAGESYTCAIDIAGVAYCWGENTYGQLGNNNLSYNSLTPVAVTLVAP